MIPTGGYVIRYHRESSGDSRLAEDGTPFFELPHRFLVFETDRPSWSFSLGLRASISTKEDELDRLAKTGEARMRWAILRWAILQIERRLRDGAIDASTERIELDAEDVPLLSQLTSQKECTYQVAEGRDHFCSASFEGDVGRVEKVGLRTFAWTSRHACMECSLPDRRFLCSHLSHPKVSLDPPGSARSPKGARCEKNSPNIRNPDLCFTDGYDCWEWVIAPGDEDKPPSYLSPALAQAFDLLDTTWRLRFGKAKGLVKLPSVTTVASIERDCLSREQFEERLVALADVLSALDIPDKALTGPVQGSLNRLEALLKSKMPEAEYEAARRALIKLRAVNDIRRAAAHGGSTARMKRVQAEKELGIGYYPYYQWGEVWNQLRAQVAQALGVIAGVLKRGI